MHERMVMKDWVYEFDAPIHEIKEKGGAYVVFPWNIREEFGKGRVKVHAEFDGVPYDGSIVNMGVRNADGSVCYVIGLLKSIRSMLGKGERDSVHVVIREHIPSRKLEARSGTDSPFLMKIQSVPRCVREKPSDWNGQPDPDLADRRRKEVGKGDPRPE